MLQIRVCQDPGRSLGISVQRAIDRLKFDFADASFGPDPAQPTHPLEEGKGLFAGRYATAYGPTPGETWWQGDFIVTLHDLAAPRAIAEFAVEFRNGENTFPYPPFLPA